jgi:hypothetical protein
VIEAGFQSLRSTNNWRALAASLALSGGAKFPQNNSGAAALGARASLQLAPGHERQYDWDSVLVQKTQDH